MVWVFVFYPSDSIQILISIIIRGVRVSNLNYYSDSYSVGASPRCPVWGRVRTIVARSYGDGPHGTVPSVHTSRSNPDARGTVILSPNQIGSLLITRTVWGTNHSYY